jgi:hypothetical protein
MPIGGVWYNELGSMMNLQQNGPVHGDIPARGRHVGQFGLVGSYDSNENTLGSW